MPFCPVCKFEYRPGIEKCPDCDIELVKKLHEEEPKPEPEVHQDVELVEVGSYPFDIAAQEAKLHLESHGIRAVLSNEIVTHVILGGFAAVGGVKVLVREEDAAKARELLEG